MSADPLAPAPGLARHDHQATAKQAALEVFPRTGTQRRRILIELYAAGSFGRTRDELAERLNLSPNTVRPRVVELLDGKWIEPNGQTRNSSSGRPAEVLTLTEKARTYKPGA